MSNVTRPLSPHLSIYRPQITSVISILHRITGVVLYAGLGLIIVFLVVVGYFPDNYGLLHKCLASGIGRLALFGWTFSLYLHFFNGIRHLFWDIGKGFDIPTVNKSGWAVIFCTLVATIFSWVIAYHNTGAF
ncbi:MAG: succinate dehydrogenase, cytochrome b556 subunit [Pseudomonadota bacterium]|mgnify:CR=1 FL=1